MKHLNKFNENFTNEDTFSLQELKDAITMAYGKDFNRIEECLSKVKIEYPNMKHKVMDMSGADQQEIIVILTISKDYMSHNPSGWYSL